MRLIILILIAAGVWYYFNGDTVSLGSLNNDFADLQGIRYAPEEPIQTKLKLPKTVKKGGYKYNLTHSFQIQALVLSKKNYRIGKESDISPTDLALGWGKMSNPNVLSQIKISQGNRFYRWRYENAPPMPKSEIIRSSANMHIAPADKNVEKALKRVRAGDTVIIQGYLMNVRHTNGWLWKSSLTRSDSGNGACELIYVTGLKVI